MPRKPKSQAVTTLEPESPEEASAGPATVAFVSLGCPKNLVDSEKMLGLLAEQGILPIPNEVAEEDGASAIVINTCGFLEASKEESLGEIQHAVELKKQGKVGRVVVAGCLVQRHRAKMLEWCPDIDAMIGVFDRDKIHEAVLGPNAGVGTSVPTRGRDVAVELPVYSSIAANATIAKQHRGITAGNEAGYFEDDSARLRLTPRHYAYLRISEGCNQNCAFCTIPSIRGKMRSKPLDRILGEARELFADGAFELNLIGQDTTSYGQDIGYQPGLVGMLKALDQAAKENGGASGGWVRLMYAYPSCFTDEMIDAIAALPSVVKYIDMPLQHINDRVLDSMRRKTSRKLIETLLAKLRSRVPGMAIRTTFISGFPGETEAEHDELVEFVRDFGFDAMGVFPYSPEPGTPAGTMYDKGGALDDEVVAARVEELMLTQQEVAFAQNARYAREGIEFDVLIDGATAAEGRATTGVGRGGPPGKLYAGRTPGQAPQVDAITYVQSRQRLSPGEVVRVKVTDHDGYDLIAKPVEELSKNVKLPVMR